MRTRYLLGKRVRSSKEEWGVKEGEGHNGRKQIAEKRGTVDDLVKQRFKKKKGRKNPTRAILGGTRSSDGVQNKGFPEDSAGGGEFRMGRKLQNRHRSRPV